LCPRCVETKLTGSPSQSRNGNKYYYYHCQKGCKERVRADEANELFEKYLASFEIPKQTLELYYHILQDVFNKDDMTRKKETLQVETSIEKLKERLIRVEDEYMDRSIGFEDYNSMKKRYSASLDDLMSKYSELVGDKSLFQ
jgi:site-specific DNA recombinase